VDGVSFDLYPGRTLGIVGESGCGKSVTSLSILRLIEPPGRIVSGEIWLHGSNRGSVDLATLKAKGEAIRSIQGSEIALIFQEPMTSFSPVHTIGNQISEVIVQHQRLNKQQVQEKAIAMLQQVGIPNPERRIQMYPFELSGGLRQRAMIAMALASDPRILIADEPTTALDVTTQAQILALMQRLQRERGMSIILITHDMGVIAEMADDVVVMYLGRVVEKGPVDDIFHNPQHPYTRSLLNSIPSIFAPPRTKLATIEGAIPHPYSRPTGCPFHPRCPASMPGVCDKREPELLPLTGTASTQEVSCFLYHSVDEVEARKET
jgi:peptide/nickel transport system ATP-binding protein